MADFLIDDEPTIFYTLEKAKEAAKVLEDADLDGWMYMAMPAKGGGWVIEVFDADGFSVAYF